MTPEPDETRPDPLVDYRYTLANERTFLAWVRTTLALLAGAVAVVQFVPDVGSETIREGLAVLLGLLAIGTATGGLVRWRVTERAMREGRPLDGGRLPLLLAVGLALVASAVSVVLVAALVT